MSRYFQASDGGFTLVEIVLVLALIGAISAVGYVAYNTRSARDAVSRVSPTPPASPASHARLDIGELGISVPLTADLADVTYVAYGEGAFKAVALGEPMLAKLDPACTNAKGADVLGSIHVFSNVPNAVNGARSQTNVVHIGQQYFQYVQPQNNCNGQAATLQAELSVKIERQFMMTTGL